MKPLSSHWADQAAARVIGIWGDRDEYVVASGITPSGVVHIGNFREVITVDLVARALRDLGKKVRFIYSWDSFDTFRKVPKNFPNQEMLQKYLRMPICRVPDPFGKSASYAEANIAAFERELAQVGIAPEYLYQHQRYMQGMYAEEIRGALQHADEIRAILDQFRTDPLPNDWLPISIYCDQCNRDQMNYLTYDADWYYQYKCNDCGHEAKVDIRQSRGIKLGWRTDWPMRWNFEKVDFEPGGKDHSSEGGSFDTSSKIVETIWHRKPPVYLQYDFVNIKGGAGKMSSSSGELITLSQAMEVYEPQMIRWIFANQRPNHDFSLAFDSDVLKTYDEFDRAEHSALNPPQQPSPKWQQLRRAYEFSCVKPELPKNVPFRAPFRELCNRLQICHGDIERTFERYYQNDVKSEQDKKLFLQRAKRAWFWVQNYADEQFRYDLRTQRVELDLSPSQKKALEVLRKIIEEVDLDNIAPQDLNKLIYDRAIHGVEIEPQQLFAAAYQKLIGRDQGPRLPGFMKEIGKEKLLQLL